MRLPERNDKNQAWVRVYRIIGAGLDGRLLAAAALILVPIREYKIR